MRHIGPIAFALVIAACGGAPPRSVPSPTPPASPLATVAAVATPAATYSPKAEGFSSKILVEKPRSLGTSGPGLIWIVAGAAPGGVSAAISEKERFTASYQAPIDPQESLPTHAAYVTPDLPPLPAGLYGESLRLVTVQSGGRSSAHVHSGIESVLVLEGRVLLRSGGNPPALLAPGEGFYILPKVPVQLINVGDAVARTLVYSISPDGAPFSTELEQAP